MSDPKLEAQWIEWGENLRKQQHYQNKLDAYREKSLEEWGEELRLRKKEDDIMALAQKMYNDDYFHKRDIHEADPEIQRWYGNKAQEIIEEEK